LSDGLNQLPYVLRGVCCVAILLVATACDKSLPIVQEKDDKLPVLTMMEPPSTAGSLWQDGNGRAYMFEDLRASRVGDIVIVQIAEDHSGSKTASTDVDRDSTYDGSLEGSLLGLGNFASALIDGVGLKGNTKSEFAGEGSTSREDSLTGTIAARVVEVLPNGDMRIMGRREVTVNSEKQTMTLAGIVRRIDLDTSNTVLSSSIAEAKIEYSGLGVVDDVQRPGWGIRIVDWIMPL
jgi:flagellar L-ring protein precursor FlgH